MNTFFSSDFHGFHQNICRGVSHWIGEGKEENTRDFNTIEEMNIALLSSINNTVGLNDELWFLGDWSFGGFDNIKKFRDQINCQNIHFVFGNHDHHIENNKNGIRDLFKSVQYYKELTIEGQKIILCHYAMRVWNKSHKGAIHLYGHSHGTLEYSTNGKSMDVGVDNAFKLFKEYRPFSFKEIKSILNKRDINFIDHHSKNTN